MEAAGLRSYDGPLRDAVSFWAQVQPEKIAYIDSQTSVTYARVAASVDAMCAALLEAGVLPGDRVVVIVPSGSAFAHMLFACMKLGVNFIPLDVLLADGEVCQRLDMTHPKLVFVTRQEHAACARDRGYRVIDVKGECEGFETLETFLSATRGRPAPCLPVIGQAEGNAPALTIFTSGTTGQPKGVLLSQVNLQHAVSSINMALQCGQDDVLLTSLPVSHIYGINTGILLPLFTGGTSVLMPKFKSEASLDAIERYGVSVYNGVPSVYKRMANAQIQAPRDLSSMRTGTIAGAKCTNLEDYERILHCQARILYGSTECPIIAMTHEGDSLDVNVSGVGRFNPTIEPLIVDEEGNALGPGEAGEIVCKSPGTMIGYLDNPEATRACIDEQGWMHTGDIAYVDAAGYVQIVGRKVDVINRGGYKVYPAEIEGAYSENPDILDCCVMGMPHEELGQQIVLFAALKAGGVDPRALRCYAKGRVAKYKIPDQVIVLEKIPYLPNGKPDKQAMARLFEADENAFHDDAERRERQGGQR